MKKNKWDAIKAFAFELVKKKTKAQQKRSEPSGKAFVTELIIFSALVTCYFFLVLSFLSHWLKDLFDQNKLVYAFVAWALIAGQGVILEIIWDDLARNQGKRGHHDRAGHANRCCRWSADWGCFDAIFSRPTNPISVLASPPSWGGPDCLRADYRAANEIIQSAPTAADQRNSKAGVLIYGILPSAAMPRIKRITHMTEKRKTSNLAIAAAPAAIVVQPNAAVTNVIAKNITAHLSIDFTPGDESNEPIAVRGCHGDLNKTIAE